MTPNTHTQRQRERNGVNIFFSVVIFRVIKNICTKLHEKILNGSQEMRNIHQNNGPKNTQTCPIAEKYLLLIVTTHKKTIAWHSLLGVILVIFGLILMYVPIKLENRSIFSHEILCKSSWYTLMVTTLNFFIHIV